MTQLDSEVLKGLPGYKMLLKALIKSQMKHLIEQLRAHVGEDCLVVTANVSECAVTHLGSSRGSDFLGAERDIMPKFLSYCLKNEFGQTQDSQPVERQDLSMSDVLATNRTTTHNQLSPTSDSNDVLSPSRNEPRIPARLLQAVTNTVSYTSDSNDVLSPSRNGPRTPARSLPAVTSSVGYNKSATSTQVSLRTVETPAIVPVGPTSTMAFAGTNDNDAPTKILQNSESPDLRSSYDSMKVDNIQSRGGHWQRFNRPSRGLDKYSNKVKKNYQTPDSDAIDKYNAFVEPDITHIKVEANDENMSLEEDEVSQMPTYREHGTNEKDCLPITGFGTQFLNPINSTQESAHRYEKWLDMYTSNFSRSSVSVHDTTAAGMTPSDNGTLTVGISGTVAGDGDVAECTKLKSPVGKVPATVANSDGTAPVNQDESLLDTLDKLYTTDGVGNKHGTVTCATMKVYNCDFCDKVFGRKDYLTQHRRVHTRERPYCCRICNKRFSQKTPMTNHIRRHHMEFNGFQES